MSDKKWIAERKLLFSPKNSDQRKELVIRVGLPYWRNEDMAACPVEFDGLFNEFADICGADLLHALHLAADVDPFLKKLSKKYDFYFDNGEPYFEDDDA